MLVVTRRAGERILMYYGEGKKIVIRTITATNKGQIKIGIEAPQEVKIVREEIDK